MNEPDPDQTVWERVRPKRRRTVEYEGEDRRGAAPVQPVNLLAWLPLLLACLAGVSGYVTLQGDMGRAKTDIAALETEIEKTEAKLTDAIDKGTGKHQKIWDAIREHMNTPH